MYLVNPSSDNSQVNGSAITGTSTKVDGGSALGIGSHAGSAMTNTVALGNTSTIYGSQVVINPRMFSAFQATPVAITSVANSGGYANYTLSTHGLTVGTHIMVSGSTSGHVDGSQLITAVTTNTFKTDKAYVASASAGSYSLVSGNFAKLVAGSYITRGGVPMNLANTGASVSTFGSDFGIRQSIHKRLHYWTTRTATAIRAGYWNIYTGKFTTLPTTADDASAIGADNEANVTLAAPGDLIFRVSGQPDGTNGITSEEYKAKTNG